MKEDSELLRQIRILSLANAVKYGGKASIKAVLGKILAEKPELRWKAKEIKEITEKLIREINKLSLEEQINELKEKAPELLEKQVVKKEKDLPDLPEAKIGGVITRFPPEPNGHLHIGHAMSALINYEYVKRYGGKFLLRFEDTNPKNEKLMYYDSIEEDLAWLGITWDEKTYNSDDMGLFYEEAEKLLRIGKAYICLCSENEIKEMRKKGVECNCRDKSVERNLELWDKMISNSFEEGEAVFRLKGDMKHANYVLRDPTLLRIIKTPHPRQGDKYVVWPTYDFACSIEDGKQRVTHVLRSEEFRLRNQLQNLIRNILDYPNPIYIEYSRFNFKGTPTSKRKIKKLIDEGKIKEWDDPRLSTIKALKRRGILPEAIREFLIQVGLTVAQPVFDWELLYSVNRSIIDTAANRYFFTPDPVKLKVKGIKLVKARVRRHPDFPSRGYKVFYVRDTFYIPGEDASRLKEGSHVRLKELFNVEIVEVNHEIIGKFEGFELKKNYPKIQWVPADNFVEVEVYVPRPLYIGEKFNPNSIDKVEGYGDPSCREIKPQEIVQFERFGFCKVEKVDRKKLTAIFTHS